MNNSIFSKEIELPNSMQLPKIHRVSPINFKVVSWVPWNFGTRRINDSEIFYYKYHPKMLTDPDLYFDFSSFLLHESFHTYKQKAWTYDHEGAEIIDPYPVNKENYALMGLEFTLLDEAMSENDYKAVQQLLFNWTIVRNYRYHKWPQLVGETKVEAIEGTARYIEYQYSKLTGGNLTVLATKQEPYHVTFMDVFDFIANGDAESPGYLERPIRYETGSALGLLMDKAKITWKEEMEDKASNPGMTQYEILKAYFNEKDMASADEKLKEILDSYDYDYLKTQGEKIAKLEQ